MRGSWGTVRLGDVADFLNGGTPSRSRPEYFEGDIPWITGADIFSDSRKVTEARSHISPEGLASCPAHLVPSGTVLLVTRTGVGKSAIAGVDLAFSQDITAVVHDSERLDAEYLVRFLAQSAPLLQARSQGATIKGVTRDVVADLLLPLPPLDEQRRLASILDTADSLRAKRRSALARLDAFPQSLFVEMFARRESSHIPLAPLRDIVRSPITRGIDQPGPEVPEGNPYIRTTDITDGVTRCDQLSRCAPAIGSKFPRSVVEVGDTVICIRATVGPALLIQPGLAGANLSRGTARVSPAESIRPEYLFAAVTAESFTRQIKTKLRGATFLQLPLAELRELEIPLPPLHEQDRFVQASASARHLRAQAQAHSGALDHLSVAIADRAFRGEL
jgi:type I restriction enzyme S subunit